jgi:hypothetical protein
MFKSIIIGVMKKPSLGRKKLNAAFASINLSTVPLSNFSNVLSSNLGIIIMINQTIEPIVNAPNIHANLFPFLDSNGSLRELKLQ